MDRTTQHDSQSGKPDANTRRRSPSENHHPQVTIGWREYVALPTWGIKAIKAKADTGARTSAIDVGHVVELPGNRVRFDVMYNRDTHEYVTVEADIARRTSIKSSFGAAHDRIIVRTTMKLGPVEKIIEVGLVSRKTMHCRMLLGRATLAPEFVVDSGHIYRFGKRKRVRKGQSTRPSETKERPA